MELKLALCGCGGMGRRHLLGMKQLQNVGRLRCRLVAVVDPFAENAHKAADLAAELLGHRPQIFATVAGMQEAIGAVDAMLVTTSPDFHVAVSVEALQAGTHVMVEKPITLTVSEGLQLVAAAARAGRQLAVAENYRRDPINRLAKALIDGGALGRPFLAVQSSSGSGEKVIITPWRHLKRTGGIAVDMGVHYADLLEYFLGPIHSLTGMGALVDHERWDPEGRRHPADAEDLIAGVLRYESGAMANLLLNMAGRGEDHFVRTIYGTGGALAIPHDRSGRPLSLTQRNGGRDVAVPAGELLRLVPDFALDDTTAALFGGQRIASYQMEWADIDASLLGIELDDFVTAIVANREPEVSGQDGLRSLAITYGLLEADRLGRTVSVAELLAGEIHPYEREIAAAIKEANR